MGFDLSSIVKDGAAGIIGAVGGIIDEFHTSPEEKAKIQIEVSKAVTAQFVAMNSALIKRFDMVKGIIQSEMASGDNYTKRARPTLVYFGMVVIFLNHILLPWSAYFTGAEALPEIELPTEFWYAWTGVVGLWIVGRSAEKRGKSNPITAAITGNDSKPFELNL